MLLTDNRGLPLSVSVAAASKAEVHLIEPLLNKAVVRPPRPSHLLYDKAADCEPLRRRLARRRLELICPHRRNSKRPPLDGRKMRRYRQRWKIERSIGWLETYRRVATRYERNSDLFLGFVQLACLIRVITKF